MRKIITVLFICISCTCYGQKDTTITDSTAFISLRDLTKFDTYLKDKVTVNQYEMIMAGLQNMVAQAATEYRKKFKK